MSDVIKRKTKLKTPSSLWWMYLPALFVVSFFIIYPFFDGLRISFTDWNGFSRTFNYIGFEQYKRMFNDPDTWIVVKNTLLYGVGSTLFQNLVGLGYALLLNQSIRFKAATSTIIYLQVFISPLVMGYMWSVFCSYQDGAVNDLVMWRGFDAIN